MPKTTLLVEKPNSCYPWAMLTSITVEPLIPEANTLSKIALIRG